MDKDFTDSELLEQLRHTLQLIQTQPVLTAEDKLLLDGALKKLNSYMQTQTELEDDSN